MNNFFIYFHLKSLFKLVNSPDYCSNKEILDKILIYIHPCILVNNNTNGLDHKRMKFFLWSIGILILKFFYNFGDDEIKSIKEKIYKDDNVLKNFNNICNVILKFLEILFYYCNNSFSKVYRM